MAKPEYGRGTAHNESLDLWRAFGFRKELRDDEPACDRMRRMRRMRWQLRIENSKLRIYDVCDAFIIHNS